MHDPRQRWRRSHLRRHHRDCITFNEYMQLLAKDGSADSQLWLPHSSPRVSRRAGRLRTLLTLGLCLQSSLKRKNTLASCGHNFPLLQSQGGMVVLAPSWLKTWKLGHASRTESSSFPIARPYLCADRISGCNLIVGHKRDDCIQVRSILDFIGRLGPRCSTRKPCADDFWPTSPKT